MPCKSKANLVRMNEDSGSSQVTRPSPPLKQQAEIELQCGALETSIFIWHSNKLLSECCMVQYSCTVFPYSTPVTAPLWPIMRHWALTQRHVIAMRAVENETVFTSTSTRTRQNSDHHFTRCRVSLQEEPHFKLERHNSSWATPMLTKHQLVITVLEWPIKANSQEAAGLPREPCQEGWRRQRTASHLWPLGCVLTAALALRIPPKQDKERTRRHRRGSRSFFSHKQKASKWHERYNKSQVFNTVCKLSIVPKTKASEK